MGKTKERLDYIDMVKGFAILCIVLGHLLPNHYYVQCIITIFHVPIFYVISGFLIKWKEEQTGKNIDLKATIKSSIKTLLIPYLFFSLVIIIAQTILQHEDINYIISLVKVTISLKGFFALWFIPSLFLAKIGFACIKKIKHKWIQFAILAVTTLCFIQIPVLESNTILLVLMRACLALFFLAIGYYAYNYIKQIKANSVLLISIILLVTLLNINLGPFGVYNLKSESILVSTILSVIQCVSIILLFMKLPTMKWLTFFGKNSMILLATHQIVFVGIIIGTVRMGIRITMFGIAIILMLAEILCVLFINRYIPFAIRKIL